MRISIIKNKKIKNIILPKNVIGSYWISDIDSNGITRNLILIEADEGKWKLISNKEVYIINNNNYSFPYTYLEEGNFYLLKNQTEMKTILLYCANDVNEYSYYDVSNFIDAGISIGNKKDNFIFCPFIKDTFLIQRVNNQLVVFDYNIPEGVYINNVRVNKQEKINYGDSIFSQGLKLTFMALQENAKVIIYLGVQKRNDLIVKCKEVEKVKPQKLKYTEDLEEVEYPLYDEKEIFNKKPRFDNELKPLNIVVDAPPSKNDQENSPFLLTIGPMVTMSMTSLVTGFTAVNGLMNGSTTMERALPSLIICGAMFASIFIWPLFINFYEKKSRKKNESKRQQKYSEYIESKKQLIADAIKEQSIILYRKYPKMNEVLDVILNKRVTLWQKRIMDEDYLTLSLGIGSCPMLIDIKYPEDHFSMVEDNLKEMVSKLGSEPKTLTDVPITFSFKENYISGLIGEEQLTGEYMRRLLVQLLAYHSYDDLKIVILTNEENEYIWKFLKDISHLFTDDKKMRFFAANDDEYKEICYYLEQIFNYRKENEKSNVEDNSFDKTYLIITDDLKKVRNFEIINSILESKNYLGFSLFVVDKKVTNLPDQIATFIQIYGEKGELCNNTHIEDNIQFTINFNDYINYEQIAYTLANIPIEFKNNEEGKLPNTIKFLEMYDVGKIEQLNVINRWQNSNPILNLAAPVGIGKNGEKISIDLHEKYHGPHGLIAGSTGSGKSEFIITYILSMAINYNPYEVQFILIDYKGGGLAGAFENSSIGLKLPHLVGTITNLDANEIKRSLASIESELKRRQALFNEAREATGESTIDIYKYQKMYRERVVSEPVSHLFIICDEFAELKVQQPEFMEQLISTARIGRSLGVHLILATQKPSGVVDPQIWSNTRFRVCLKVQDKSDSNDVIKCPDAAYLKQTGRFYFQVGYNEVFTLGQAAWAGGKYIPKEKVNRTIDTSIEFINNIGYPIKIKETKEKNSNIEVANLGEELTNIVKYLSEIAKIGNIKCRPLWLQKLPAFIRIEDLQAKYNYSKTDFILNPIIGEYDIPKEQMQKLLTLPLSMEGNAAVYGASGSGKENFLTTLIYSLMLFYSVNEVNTYIIDFGAETLQMFKDAPIVGDILSSGDEEKVYNLFKMLKNLVNERKKLFAPYGGDYLNYCKNSGKSVPNIVVIINNFEGYQENFANLEEEFTIFTRDCTKYGIYFVVTVNSPNGLRFKIRQNFGLIYTLQQNNNDDYATVLGNVYKNYPANIYGRGLIKIDDIYEFQTAMVCDREEVVKYIKEKSREYAAKSPYKAREIPILPDVVTYENIKNEFGKTKELIVGINKEDLSITTFDYIKYYTSIISALDLSLIENFVNPIINELVTLNNTLLYVINMEELNIAENSKKYYKYFDNNVNELFTSIYNYVIENNTKYQDNNLNKNIFNNIKPLTVMIIGIDSFKNNLTPENQNKLDELFSKGKRLGIINFIIIDTIDKIKKIELDSWYRGNVNNTYGIWLGSGVNEQFSIKINQRIPEMREDTPDNFCFVIKRGKVEYVKYLESFNIK